MNNEMLPEKHEPYTDKYFLRANEILKKEGLNPKVSMKVFARGQEKIAGLEQALAALKKYSDLEKTGEVWVTKKKTYENKEPLMIIKGPVQSFIELETMYLGVLSGAISQANGYNRPDLKEVEQKLRRLKEIYKDIPITYFGARHYPWHMDKKIAGAAIKGGAKQTSSDIGSSNIGLKGVGTTPHILTIVLSLIYGKEQATLKTAQLFDKHMPKEIPRVTLVDTFNRELSDSLSVAKYFETRKNAFRIDTCGENIGEGGSFYNGKKARDPEYKTGTGVTIELAKNLRLNLINNGYGDFTETFLSSGFGDEEKAKEFVKANHEFKKQTGYSLFMGVGIGEVYPAKFCTADLFEVNDKPLSKTGREAGNIDYNCLERII
ncbi:MAG: nicotinate phosphoribosyltransferase [Nanoarchaeota archaeon]|nr:nicotinate phosphoribosyltransferase [Nanoarchaeota archaeon]MBU1030987.1 nicotinate phosphoribosyltransferase [Nanoarchaeota archaeon]